MSQFTGPLTLTHLDADWRRWRLEQALAYEVGALGSGRFVIVPAGFVTDGASIPRLLWWLLPAWGRYSRAAVVHDYCCVMYGALAPADVEAPVGSRREGDAVFYEAMKVCGVSFAVRFVMWAAVRAWSALKRAPA